MENIKDKFRKEFCECCGSQRCSGQDDELVYCERFKNLMDNSGKPSVKNHKMGPKSKLPSKYYEEIQTKRDMDETVFMIGPVMVPDKVDDKLEYEIIDGYEFDKVENNKIILKPIKPKYPKTYKECCDVLLIPPYYNLRYHTYERGYNEYATSNILLSLEDKLNTLGKLIICCKAYWKIAGEEMGLGKPWEPDWTNEEQKKYCIYYSDGNIQKGTWCLHNSILAFPSEEMRDAFFEDFKDLFEQCKELL